MYKNIKVIAFDADDTLWINETYFREVEKEFTDLLSTFDTKNNIDQILLKKEIKNLKIYGYGIKGFVLSMIECALEISDYQLPSKTIQKIIGFGKDMLEKPIELLDGVEEVLQKLQGRYKLIVATKGDLLDQEKKIEKSGLLKYFDDVVVMSDKKEVDYKKILKRLNIKAPELLMIGNSLRSDVLPLIKIKASAIHIPFHTTWIHETVSEEEISSLDYKTIKSIKDILSFL